MPSPSASLPGSTPPDVATYSRFKHGDGATARLYGESLAALALARVRRLGLLPVVVTGSGFDVVPPAAHSLVAPFTETLRAKLGPDTPVTAAKIVRTRPSESDYAAMDATARRTAISGALDVSALADTVRGAHVIALDDVIVTGLHEHAADQALRDAGAAAVDHLYVVDAHCQRHTPWVESELNQVAVRTVEDVLALAARTDFVPNSRVARLVFALSQAELVAVAATAPESFLIWLTDVAATDPLAAPPRYADGVLVLRELRSALLSLPR
ncbi:phosphoribosyltransferase family protein [Xylanimonas protaetiae]|uniref:phosphoribosyltransferase family protein n=1 Tax=Xylanimonas protaetiae TaxID=2509457 RepID=UPI0013ED489D|nr:phosphoribosyltransferase family protein [Xylanimonas protaetiae]